MGGDFCSPRLRSRGVCVAMQLTVLAIIIDGVPLLSIHPTQSAAWSQLISFIEERWSERMGSIAPPVDDETKARVFFEHSGDDLYAIIGADLSELRVALGSVSDRVEG